MSANVTHGFAGYLEGKKVSGSGTFTGQLVIPYIETITDDPSNNTYMPMVNKALGPSLFVKGKHTPSLQIRTCLMSAWATVNALKSFIITTDANSDTDLWAFRSYEEDTEILDGCRCAALSLAAEASGGPVACDMAWLVTTTAGSTSFTGSGGSQFGEVYNAGQIDFGGTATADLVRSWRMNIARPNAYDFFFNRSYFANDISSGQAGGTFSLVQSAKAATIPSAAITIRLYTGDPGSQTLAMTLACNINLDTKRRARNVGFGMVERYYSMIDTAAGGVPVTIS